MLTLYVSLLLGCTCCLASELAIDVLYTPELCEHKSQEGDFLEYHYVGRFVDGSEFDCSFNYNQPYKFTLGRREVIEGMDKGLVGICIGERRKITIPPEMAYGEGGVGDTIPPNATLVFYVDLLSIKRNNVTLSPTVTSDQLLYMGTEAYTDERWQDCIEYLESAISAYNDEQDKLLSCLSDCEESLEADIMTEESVDSSEMLLLNRFHYFFKKHECVSQCKAMLYGKKKTYQGATAAVFEDKTVYNYLQMCYYHLGEVDDARHAAETFYDFNVGNELGINNMHYYASLRRENPPQYSPREHHMEHQKLYRQGRIAYGKEDYSTVIEAMEGALAKYYLALQKCQLKCIGNFTVNFDDDLDNELGDDALTVVARYVSAQVLCCTRCEETLTFFEVKPGLVEHRYLSSHYHYLQFAYYKMGDFKNASQCAGTHRLFHPDDDVMAGNIRYYQETANASNIDLMPRQEAFHYQVQQTKLAMLLNVASIPNSARKSTIPGQKGDTGEVRASTKEQKKNLDKQKTDAEDERNGDQAVSKHFENGSPIIRGVLEE
ncbi:cartilage-associated protein-like [Corticium candelabrum]|uniref:cartilage-associated protein-like n=1 Tax=Corticium candelabrum TaxID=121492 RepID=UPI002E25DD02|nr:cartilage-associated protein-like [Corticium candelabrum]